MALLEVRNLRTEFHTNEGIVHAVNGISYQVDEGETVAIVGESGCGKTVSVLSLMRLLPEPPGRIVEGEALFEGRDLLQLPARDLRDVRGSRVAMIFQDPMTSFNPTLTIGRQVGEAMEVHQDLSASEARSRAVDLLRMVGIPEAERRLGSYPHQFSGGMRQRAMIAMALSCNPRLLIADEPTTALDVTIQAQIIDLVKRLRDELGMAIVWITHDMGIVAGLADRVLVMYAGFMVEAAPVDEMYANPRHPYTQGLLRSLPRLDEDDPQRLLPIDGQPPDLIKLPAGCPFAPRCPYRIGRCLGQNPPLDAGYPGHEVACWVDVSGGRLREQ